MFQIAHLLESTSLLHHPNVVGLVGLSREPGTCLMLGISPYVTGAGSLQEALQGKNGPSFALDPESTIMITKVSRNTWY